MDDKGSIRLAIGILKQWERDGQPMDFDPKMKELVEDLKKGVEKDELTVCQPYPSV